MFKSLNYIYLRLQEQAPPNQHQNQNQNSTAITEVRTSLEDNANQSKQYPKPYAIQSKQYPAIETLTNSIPATTLNSESDKRNSQQQVKPQFF